MRISVRTFGSAVMRAPRPTASATREDTPFPEIRQPVSQHPGEILARLGNGRDAAGLLYPPGSGVVGGDGERQVAAVAVEQHAQVPAPALDVVAGQEDIADLMPGGRFGHE